MNELLFAQVAVENTVYHFDRLFTYLVPPGLVGAAVPGARVLVPFGSGNRGRIGMIFSLSREGEPEGLKAISSVLDREPLLTEEMLRLALWLRERCYCTYFEAVKPMIPSGLRFRVRDSFLLDPAFVPGETLSPVQRQIVAFLKDAGRSVTEEKLSEKLGVAPDSPELMKLLRMGAVQKVNTAVSRLGDATSKMVRPIFDFEGKLTPRQKEVYETLLDAGEASEKELCYFTGASPSVVRALAQKGAAEIFEYEVYRRPELVSSGDVPDMTALSEKQEAVYRALNEERLDPKAPRCALLYGVTGSGKTSVFMKLIRTVHEEGKGVIVMVPEISLTPQAIRRFQSAFGEDIAVFHSGLSLGERMDEWKRVRRGEVRIVIGTRSAVFAPVRDLGLIVIDEEQEHTYRSESAPRYDAREVARMRCAGEGAFCLLSSATPSVDSYRMAQAGRFGFHVLSERYGAARLPEVRLVDMNLDGVPGEGAAIGDTLARALTQNYAAGRQSIVLLNRRGYHTFAVCGSCHEPVTCPHCSISLTYHRANGRLMCHYCGYSVPFSTRCPSCGEEAVTFRGLGTQRAEEQLRELLPEARILRLDTDAVSARYALETKLGQFARGEYDVMVGTQMVAKGLDFENVTLVGVLSADQSLYADDYRASERTFDLLDQVVGRAGRGKYPGMALIQTYVPENPVLHFAANQDYPAFFEQEIAYRQALLYPPFVDLLVLGFAGEREGLVRRAAETFLESLESLAKSEYPRLPLRVLRPTPAAVARVSGKYRYKLIIKCRNTPAFREMISRLLKSFAGVREYGGVTVYADPNPYRIF